MWLLWISLAPRRSSARYLALGEKTGWFGGRGYRYLGPRPLTEDGAFFSPTTGILPYGREVSIRQRLDAPARRHQFGPDHYADGSLLPTEALYSQCNGPVANRPPVRGQPEWRHGPGLKTGRALATAINARWQVLKLASPLAIIRHAERRSGDVSLHGHCRGDAFPPSLRLGWPQGGHAALPARR